MLPSALTVKLMLSSIRAGFQRMSTELQLPMEKLPLVIFDINETGNWLQECHWLHKTQQPIPIINLTPSTVVFSINIGWKEESEIMHSATSAQPSPQAYFRGTHVQGCTQIFRKGDHKVQDLQHSKSILLSFQDESFLSANTWKSWGHLLLVILWERFLHTPHP